MWDAEASRVYTRRAARPDGQSARTSWSVERRWSDRTLLRVVPKTGRRHQIRVHLESIGHAVLGDLLYGRDDEAYLTLVGDGRDVRVDEGGPLRQLLHCARLEFPEEDGGSVAVAAPLPDDFDLDRPR